MPHPKNHLKLTGNTHLPDVGDDGPDGYVHTASVAPPEDEPLDARAETFTMAPRRQPSSMEEAAVNVFGDVRDRVLANPLLCLLGAFTLGYVTARAMSR